MPVDFRDGGGCKFEVVGQELIRFSLVVHEFDESELARTFFDRGGTSIFDAFVRDHAFFRQSRAVLSGNLKTGVVFDSRDEESPGLVDLPEPVQIVIPLIEGVDAVRNDFDVLLCGPDIGHLPVGHQHIAGQIAGQVQLRVEFDRALVLPVACPVVDSQAQRYGRAVDGVERVFELEVVTAGSAGTRAVEDFLEHRTEDFRGTPVHCVRQG